jgi:integrase
MLSPSVPELSGDLKPQANRAKLVIELGELTERCRQGLPSKVPKLSAKVLAALVPSENGRDVFVSTGELPCFAVRITKDGHRSFCVQHRTIGRHTIGDVRVKPLDQALKRARVLLDAARDGRNLIAEEKTAARQRQAEQTVAAIVEQYLAEPMIRRLKSYSEKARYLRSVWAPIHDLLAESIDRHALLPVLRRIASERGERSANLSAANLSAMFVHAVEHGWLRRDNNPAAFLPRWQDRKRERVLDLEELGLVWHACGQLGACGSILRLLMLTGCRRSAIADLLWPEVDIAKALITLPAGRVKNEQAFVVPLPPAALAILKQQPRLHGERVFRPISSWARERGRLDALVKLDPPWVIHDLRRSARTGWIEELGLDVHLAELMLGHALRGVVGTYDRSQRLAERRRALERWAELVLRAAGERTQAAQVVHLR